MSLSITNISPSTLQDGDSVTLTGSGFGASQGSVVIGGVAQSVSAWSDTSITFTAARSGQSMGSCRVDVVSGVSGGYTPTVIVTNQTELNTELAKSAAQLEGQVIGVVYNATPYTISQAQLQGKDFGAGGLVICQSGGTMPVFSSIKLDGCNAATLYALECYDGSGASGGKLITLYNAWSNITIESCVVHGKYYDPNGDYSLAGSYTNRDGIGYSGSGGSNVTVTNCTVYDVYAGIDLKGAGYVRIIGNTLYNTYADALGVNYDAGNTEITVNWNVGYNDIGLSSDAGGTGAHGDFFQIGGGFTGGVTTAVTFNGNRVFIGNARADYNGVFCNVLNAGNYVQLTAKGNLILTNSLHGISINRASSSTVIGNTVLSGDVDGGGSDSAIRIGNTESTGTHTIKNNVAHAYNIGGAPASTNNHPATRSTAAYAALVDGTSFAKTPDLDTLGEVMLAFAMKVGGALDATTNIGAVGSGYVDYTARTLNGAME